MNFVTLEFATFFLFVLVAGWLLRERDGEYRAFLLVCNLFFYALAGMAFVPLLLAVAVLNWGAVHLMSRFSGQPRKRKGVIALDVALHVALLAFFKYYEFLILGLESLASAAGLDTGILRHALPSMEILFPVGLSFYTFQGLSYAIDHYRCPDEPPRAFLDVLLFVSFFPTIMAGPIMRARQFLPQLGHRTWDSRDLQEGFALILSGLFKKVVIASYLSEHIVRDVFESPEFYSSWTILAAVYAYSIQIFCDFSGYSDMAIGVGRLMGFRLPENFRSPYLALNIQDFWRRWHISLSTWFRDYLYFPLGGSRKGKARTYINVLIVFALSGLWHGAAMKYVLWGLLFGVFQVIGGLLTPAKQRLCAALHIPWDAGWLQIIRVIITFGLSTFAWIFFRADSALQACAIIKRIVTAAGACFPLNLTHLGLTERALNVLAVSLIGLVLTDIIGDRFPLREKLLETVWLRYAVWVILLAVTAVCGAYGTGFNPQEFVYFQF